MCTRWPLHTFYTPFCLYPLPYHSSHTITLSQTAPHTPSLSHKPLLTHCHSLTNTPHTPSLSHIPLLKIIHHHSLTYHSSHISSLSHKPPLTNCHSHIPLLTHHHSLTYHSSHTHSHIPLLTHSLSHTTPHTPSIIKWYSTMLDNLGLDVLGRSFSHMQSHPHTLTLSHPHSLDKESNRC